MKTFAATKRNTAQERRATRAVTSGTREVRRPTETFADRVSAERTPAFAGMYGSRIHFKLDGVDLEAVVRGKLDKYQYTEIELRRVLLDPALRARARFYYKGREVHLFLLDYETGPRLTFYYKEPKLRLETRQRVLFEHNGRRIVRMAPTPETRRRLEVFYPRRTVQRGSPQARVRVRTR